MSRRFIRSPVPRQTHLFLNSTFANQARQRSAQPHPELVVHPDDASSRGIADGARVRAFNDRGGFECAARVSDDASPGVVVAPMGWWSADWSENGRAAQATTSQRLTKLGSAPTFNDNRVEVEVV